MATKPILPGSPQLWKNSETDTWWVVYQVPGVPTPDGKTSEPIFTAWSIDTDEDLEAIVGPGITPVAYYESDNAAFTERGVIDLGGVTELVVSDIEGDPFDTWVEDMTVLAAVQPWLLESDYISLVVQAAMERVDGAISLEEIQSTNWWKDHTAAERQWMETFHGDPATAERILEDNRSDMAWQLQNAGIDNATPELVNWMADRTTTGAWSAAHLGAQLSALADPYSVDAIDDELFEFMANNDYKPDHTMAGEDRVRELMREWLGPVYGDWDESEISRRAGDLRNNPDGEQELIESLKDQRMAMYPEYTDRESSYEAIASPWRTFSQGVWGTPVEDHDEVFQQVVRANDPREAGKLLRKAGVDRGYDRTVSTVIDGIQSGMKANVRGAV